MAGRPPLCKSLNSESPDAACIKGEPTWLTAEETKTSDTACGGMTEPQGN
jgi:hypothetical protein